MKTRDIALAGLMTALTFVITRAFILPIPQTKGFFNIGEAAVYTAAILFGARIGAIAGGLGSALADLSLGFAAFAPYTLVIKGIEGYVVGALGHGPRRAVALVGPVIGLAMGIYALTISSWLVRSAGAVVVLVAAASLLLLFRGSDRYSGIRIAAMISGGLLMILGYFLVQAFIFQLGVPAALVEVPYNTVQMAVGIVAGLISAATFEQALLQPSR